MAEKHLSASFSRSLTPRQQSIIEILAKTAGNPVPVEAVAEKLDVSSRTVLRELPAIERWMNENDFTFTRRPGVGLAIEESPEHIQLLTKLLGMEQAQPLYSPKERRRQILGELLFLREPVKSYVFLSRFHISEGTLARDLDALDEWLSAYQVRIVRRPGVGIRLYGSENAFRQAIANAALEFMEDAEILKILRGNLCEETAARPQLRKNRLFSFIDPQVVLFVEQILTDTEQKLNIKYTDSGYMALIVHLSLSVRRLRSGEKIEMDPEDLKRLMELPEYPAARQIADQIGQRFQIPIPKEEAGFITMHLSSARIWPQNRRARSQLQSVNTSQIVMAIVDSVEKEIGLPFHTCTKMIEELTSHMDSMISRLTMNIRLDNAQGEAVRQKYPDICQAVERACGLFRDRLYIQDISPSEITFVAMHFAAAAETLKAKQKRVAAAVVCPSGMGASRMLAASLMRTLHQVEVRQVMSAFSLDPKKLSQSGIDLVISTVPLEIDFPYVCVSPIPQAQDLLMITRALESISAQREKEIPAQIRLPASQPEMTAQDIRSLTRIGEEITQLLDYFVIQDVSGIRQRESLLGQAAALFADSILSRQVIGQDLAHREAIRNTFLPEFGIHLLHCRTGAVPHCRCGYLRLDRPFPTPEGEVSGAILLLAPVSDCKECVEVVSQISMLFVEEQRFLQALKEGDASSGRALAEKALVKYYQNQIIKRKGDGTL